MKCNCGFIWTDEAILKGYDKDDGGVFFRCPIAPKDYEYWDNCMGYIGSENYTWKLFEDVKNRYDQLITEKQIKQTQSKHKFLITDFKERET